MMQHIRLLNLYAKKNCSVLNRVFPRRQIMRYNSFNNIILATSLINNFSRAISSSSSPSIMTPPSSTTTQSPSSNGADNDCLLPPEHMQSYKVINNTKVSCDSNLLTIALPNERSILGCWEPDIPTCISISKTEEERGNILKKSYSPISHPSQPHNVQLLVKSYPHRIGGGVGSYLCNLQDLS